MFLNPNLKQNKSRKQNADAFQIHFLFIFQSNVPSLHCRFLLKGNLRSPKVERFPASPTAHVQDRWQKRQQVQYIDFRFYTFDPLFISGRQLYWKWMIAGSIAATVRFTVHVFLSDTQCYKIDKWYNKNDKMENWNSFKYLWFVIINKVIQITCFSWHNSPLFRIILQISADVRVLHWCSLLMLFVRFFWVCQLL